MIKKSKIGLRLFFLFLFTAVVPVVATVAYFGHQLQSTTQQRAKEQLAADAKNYSDALLAKLTTAKNSLDRLSFELIQRGPEHAHIFEYDVFTAVAIKTINTPWQVIFGDTDLVANIPQQLKNNQISIITNRTNTSDVAIHSAFEDNNTIVLAILNPVYLWMNEIANSGVIYTIRNKDQILSRLYRENKSGELKILNKDDVLIIEPMHDDEMLTQSRGVNLSGIFASGSWQVSATQHGENNSLASASSAQALFVIAFSILLLVALISSRQIRQIVAPLTKLTDATQRLARQDFHEPIEISRNDEFGQLANAFNNMSDKLGRQFDTLQSLTVIDESILTGEKIRDTSQLALRKICEILSCQQSMLCLLPEDKPGKIHSLHYTTAKPDSSKHSLHRLSLLDEGAALPDIAIASYLSTAEYPELFTKMVKAGAKQMLTYPVTSSETVVAYIAAGFEEVINHPESLMAALESFGRRIGVAIRSAQNAEKLHQRANYDALTNLTNRAHFIEKLNEYIANTDPKNTSLVLMFIDLDRFKHVNDVQGHEAGDKLLQHVAEQLKMAVPDDAIVARFGGDEFLVLLPETKSSKYIEVLARTIITELCKPIVIDFHEHFIDSSIGIAMYPEHGNSAEMLIKHTDIAMYAAKQSGGGNYRLFDSQMNAHAMKRVALESALYHAIEKQELFLAYQPKICLKTGVICGVEALIRWQHPIHGSIPPDLFISIAEDTGQIIPIGNWILEEASKQIRSWQKQGLHVDHIAINASVRQIKAEGFAKRLNQCLVENGISASSIQIEITESMFIDDMENSVAVLEDIHTLGIGIAIDDFGTGYSSLSYLTQLPFDTLKIDRSFLERVNDDENASSLASAIIAMAHSLDKKVVAEGVESEGHIEFLTRRDCDIAQGYFYSKPLIAAELADFVSQYSEKQQATKSNHAQQI